MMKKKVTSLLFPLICLVLCVSCGKNNDNKVIKYEDIGEKAQSNTSMNLLPSEDDNNEDTTLNLSNLDIEISKTYNLSTNDFLDRFQSEESFKRLILTSNDSIYFKSWSFQDSTACMNAFYNLLDCFGKGCTPIELYSTDFIASNYNLLLVIENQIHSINSKENQNLQVWHRYFEAENNISEYRYILEQKRNQSMTWFEYNREKSTLKKVNNDQ